MTDTVPINPNAFSAGQLGSKLWLCDELEKIKDRWGSPPNLWILAGWYGLLAFLLLTRQRISLGQVVSFDSDANVKPVADMILEGFLAPDGPFSAHTQDITELRYQGESGFSTPDIVVNTACEHLVTTSWFEPIPAGTLVIAQSTDLPDVDHVARVDSEAELKEQLPLSETHYLGTKLLNKASTSYRRFMIMGVK